MDQPASRPALLHMGEDSLSRNPSLSLFRRKRSIVVVLAVIVATALCEIALRVYDTVGATGRDERAGASYTLTLFTSDGQTKLSAHGGRLKLALAPYLPYRHLPNQSDPWFHINSRGFRGDEVDLSPSVTRIALVGGSAAFGDGAESDEATLAKALERRLDGVQVINAAVNGYVSGDELAVLRLDLMELKPSLVIALDAFNDYSLGRLVNSATLANTTYEDIELRLARFQRIQSNPIYSGLAFFRSLMPHLSARLDKLERLPARIRREMGEGFPDDHLEAKLDLYTKNVSKMHATTKDADLPFLVLLQPQRPNVWRDWEHHAERYSRFIQGAEGFFRGKGVDHINLHTEEAIRKDHFLQGDDVHFNPAGVEVIAEIVARHIRRRQLLPKSTERAGADARASGDRVENDLR